jgi:hypothetical protein
MGESGALEDAGVGTADESWSEISCGLEGVEGDVLGLNVVL